jgi:hypothetical protein
MAYTTIDDPSEHFTITLYTGTGANQDVVNSAHSGDFKPDLLVIKNRGNGSYGPHWYDSSRGVKKYLYSDQNYGDDEETNNANGSGSVQLFNTNGFRGGSSTNIYEILWTNGLNNTYVAWQWKVAGGTTASNSDGDITSTTQVNTTAGLSIITYTGSGTTDDTIGHGLGVEPDIAIFKRRDVAAGNWDVQHNAGNPGAVTVAYRHTLNLTEGTATNVLSSFSSSTLGLSTGGDAQKNVSGSKYVCYAFKAIQGYSAFGSYYGNASTNGEFVYLGFKPAMVIFKVLSDPNYGWSIMDDSRSSFNEMDDNLYLNRTDAEATNANRCDFLSNGFKLRGSTYPANAGGTNTFAYFAWAENPFVTSTGIPTTAR